MWRVLRATAYGAIGLHLGCTVLGNALPAFQGTADVAAVELAESKRNATPEKQRVVKKVLANYRGVGRHFRTYAKNCKLQNLVQLPRCRVDRRS